MNEIKTLMYWYEIDGVDLSSDADKELDCTESDKCVNCKHFTYFRLDPYCKLQQRAVEPGDVCGAHERLRLSDK